MAQAYAENPVVKNIDMLIEEIKSGKPGNHVYRKIPTREQFLNIMFTIFWRFVNYNGENKS